MEHFTTISGIGLKNAASNPGLNLIITLILCILVIFAAYFVIKSQEKH